MQAHTIVVEVRFFLPLICGFAWLVLATIPCRADTIVVGTDFEGGSARVIDVDQENAIVRIMPGGDPLRGWPAWWYCRISGLTPGRTLTLHVVPSSLPIPAGHPGAGKPLAAGWALPMRANWSEDQIRWRHTAAGKKGDAGMSYQLTPDANEVWVAWGPVATPKTVADWITNISQRHDFVESFELAKTLERRSVRGVRIAAGEIPMESRPVIWLQARQHAWESGSSWVARGIGEWMLSGSPDAIWLRENTLIFLVPIMDVDRAATGDGGKESTPHDHNRDWSDDPHYPEVAAVQSRIKRWTVQNRMAVFVDLHNPGPNDHGAFFYVAPDEAIDQPRELRRRRFLDSVTRNWDAPIPFDPRMRSTGPNYHRLWRQISGTWVTEHANQQTVAVCLETPWNTASSTTEGYAKVGASLGKGISRFLRSDKSKDTP